MSNESIITIEQKKLLLVEGKDEVSFLKEFMVRKTISGIQISDLAGRYNFTPKRLLTIMNTPNFNTLKSLAIIQDADINYQDRFKSICSVFKRANEELEKDLQLTIPTQIAVFTKSTPKIGVFLIPGNNKNGMLESLCLSTIKSDPATKAIIKCIDAFIECIKQATTNQNVQYNKPKNIHKARLRAFLSAMEDDTPSLGIAAQKDYWNWDSEKLTPLLNFLKQI